MLSLAGSIWKLRGENAPVLEGSLLERVLARRGVMPSQAALFLSPRLADLASPFAFSQMDQAIELLKSLKFSENGLFVYGDYDVDGISSSVILNENLRALGLRPNVYIPERLKEGYGMKLEVLKELVKKGAQAVVTVDTGITNLDEIEFLKKKKIKTIILDHHEPEKKLPPADVILNPKTPGERYPFKELSSAGIALQLARALNKKLSGNDFKALNYLDLAALGTISDVVPLLSDNRIIAKFGLKKLSSSSRPGIRALRKFLDLDGGAIDAHHVGFMIGPRLNAAGRIKHARLAYDLLASSDLLEAFQIVQHLSELNILRQTLTDQILNEARAEAAKQLRHKVLILAGKDWSIGVAGIVASRLAEEFSRPAIVLEEDGEILKGSARSVEGIDLHKLISTASKHLATFGGHKGAAGLSLKKKDLAAFKKKIWQEAKKIPKELFTPTLILDEVVYPNGITAELYQELSRLKPYGEGNEKPLLWLREVKIREAVSLEGNRGPHLKVLFEGLKMPAFWFGQGDKAAHLDSGQQVDAAISLGVNNYLGQSVLRLRLHDLRPTS